MSSFGHVRHPADDVVEICSRIYVVVAACGQKGHYDAHVPGSFVVAAEMEELCNKWFPSQLVNLQTIPGIKGRSATSIIAELGTDMSSFEDAAHLVSWCGLKPRNEESAGKIKSTKITHGNKYLRKTLIECSWAASKTQGCFYNKFSYHQTVVKRKNKMKVQVAIACKMLTAIWFILHYNIPYRDFIPDIVPAA